MDRESPSGFMSRMWLLGKTVDHKHLTSAFPCHTYETLQRDWIDTATFGSVAKQQEVVCERFFFFFFFAPDSNWDSQRALSLGCSHLKEMSLFCVSPPVATFTLHAETLWLQLMRSRDRAAFAPSPQPCCYWVLHGALWMHCEKPRLYCTLNHI